MKIEDVTIVRSVEVDPNNFAEQAFVMVEEAFGKDGEKADLQDFLASHIEKEDFNAKFYEEFEGKPYHPYVGLACEKRKEAYQLMLSKIT